MKVIQENNSKLEQKNNSDFISNIINRIFLICKNDKNFKLKNQTEEIEFKISTLQKKIDSQDKLILQADDLYKNVKRRVDILNSENSELRTNLIESLGG